MSIIKTKAFARAGLVGNPSDGYFGKTISVIVKNMCATVTLWESPELHIEQSKRDLSTFRCIDHLCDDIGRFGYYSGVRLMKATIRRFRWHCDEKGLRLAPRNFTVRHDSNIPRHVGLAGSSALITAFLRALCQFYEVEIPLVEQPNLILSVETEELGISAGLQDRVIQVYEGVVYMDFDRKLLEETGHGEYVPIDPALLPPLFIAYRTDLKEGSEVFHNDIRRRFNEGDPTVTEAMRQFGQYAELSYRALTEGRPHDIGECMDANFDLRAKLYPIAERNLEMVTIGRGLGAHVKYSGSGGAVIGTHEDPAALPKLREAYLNANYKIFTPRIV